MIITVVSFNGHAINDGENYRARALNASSPPSAKPVFRDSPKADSNFTGTFTVDIRSLAIGIEIVNYADRHALVEQLRGWFHRGTEGNLVVTLSVDGQNYFMPCVVQNLVEDQLYRGFFTAILQTGQTAWVSVERDTDDWEATNEAPTKTITVEGTEGVETQLNVDLMPTVVPSSGFLYQKLYRLPGKVGRDFGVRPWCIQLDTAALVTAGKMRADCYDLMLFIGAQEARRWIADPNTDHTKVWFNPTIGPGYDLVLRTEVENSLDVPEALEFVVTTDSRAALNAMPYQGIVYHGTEWFSYEGKNADTGMLYLKARGLFGTTVQAHLAGVTFSYIQNAIFIYHGNPTSTDPAAGDANYDDTKPIFDLSASSNAEWHWDKDLDGFYDTEHPNRPGQWYKEAIMSLGAGGHHYTTEGEVVGADPAIGIHWTILFLNGAWQWVHGTMSWRFSEAAGISTVALTGRKKCTGGIWPMFGNWFTGLMVSADGLYWPGSNGNEVYAPSTSDWEAVTIGERSVYDWPHIRMNFYGAFANPGGAGADSYLELSTCTVVFTAANLPTGSLLDEVANYPLAISIRNNRNGDSIGLLFPMNLDQSIELDSEEKTALYNGLNVHGCILLNDESRPVWIRLLPGENELEIVAEDIGTIELALSWHRRRI